MKIPMDNHTAVEVEVEFTGNAREFAAATGGALKQIAGEATSRLAVVELQLARWRERTLEFRSSLTALRPELAATALSHEELAALLGRQNELLDRQATSFGNLSGLSLGLRDGIARENAALREQAQTMAELERVELARHQQRLASLREEQAALRLVESTMNRIANTVVGALGDGIAEQLVEGTYDWAAGLKLVLKQIIAVVVKMLIAQAINKALGGGLNAGGLVSFSLIKLHEGGAVGQWPRHHAGVLATDEHPAILQRGEYVLRRDAVRMLGRDNLDLANRNGLWPGGAGDNLTFNINVSGDSRDGRELAERIAEPLLEIIRREKRRNREVF